MNDSLWRGELPAAGGGSSIYYKEKRVHICAVVGAARTVAKPLSACLALQHCSCTSYQWHNTLWEQQWDGANLPQQPLSALTSKTRCFSPTIAEIDPNILWEVMLHQFKQIAFRVNVHFLYLGWFGKHVCAVVLFFFFKVWSSVKNGFLIIEWKSS